VRLPSEYRSKIESRRLQITTEQLQFTETISHNVDYILINNCNLLLYVQHEQFANNMDFKLFVIVRVVHKAKGYNTDYSIIIV